MYVHMYLGGIGLHRCMYIRTGVYMYVGGMQLQCL